MNAIFCYFQILLKLSIEKASCKAHSKQKNDPTNFVKQSQNIQSFGSLASFLFGSLASFLVFFDTMYIKRSKKFSIHF